jgi:N-acetylmuramoyl-L-alanine amidase
MCLALMVFHEAGNQSTKGKMATIEVVQNRVKAKRYKDTPCGVIKEPRQFSWVNSSNRALNKAPSSVHKNSLVMRQWKESQAAVKQYMSSPTNYTKGSEYFNTLRLGVRYKTDVSPTKIGNHIFY